MAFAKDDIKVLIAEDHFAVRQIVTMALRAKDVSVIDTATDGRQTRDSIDQAFAFGNPYHMIFLDWDMPLISGIDILKHYRAQKKFDQTAFIMVTAMSLQSQVLDAVKAGATTYVIKPISLAIIGKKYDEMLAWVGKQRATDDRSIKSSG